MEKQNDLARKAARRLERNRRRLELGSDYESSRDSEDEDYDSDEDDDDDDEVSRVFGKKFMN